MAACDFHEAMGRPDWCHGWHSGGVDGRPSSCDDFLDVIDAGRTIAWAEYKRVVQARRAEVTAEVLDTLHDFLFDGSMPCGCVLLTPVKRCADHAATMTAKYPAGVLP